MAGGLYGLAATARALPGEYDDNFHLVTAEGGERVLKVLHPERDPAWLDLQCRALVHLAERAPHLPLPRVCSTPSGEPWALWTDGEGRERLVWLLTWLRGRVLAEARPRSPAALEALGRLLGEMDAALTDFTHDAATRELKWDLGRALWIRDLLPVLPDPRRALVERILGHYEAEVAPAWPALRQSVIYGDANDWNVLVAQGEPPTVAVIDFGDMHRSATVAEVAIAAAYSLLGERDPLAAAARVVAGYHSALPLTEEEIALLPTLIATRLAVSVANAAERRRHLPDDPYVAVSEAPAWEALERLAALPERLAHYTLRDACGLPPVPASAGVAAWLARQEPAPVLGPGVDLATAPSIVFDLSVGSLLLGADPRAAETGPLTETLWREMDRAGVALGIGRYDEPRRLYTSNAFATGGHETSPRRTIHLGIDLFAVAGTPVHAPLAGTVHTLADNAAPKDYGPLVILAHRTDGGTGETFYTLYGHLGPEVLSSLADGQEVAAGERLGSIGAPPGNGDWPPHLHFQVIVDLLGLGRDFPGVGWASSRAVWLGLSPDPNGLLRIPAERFPAPEPTREETLAARKLRLGRNLSLSYRRPLKIVRGFGAYLYDDTGRAYLDVYNNVPLVGHSHPRVVAAVQAQAALLTTNTRYLHDNLTRYAERLTARMPAPLSVCFFLSSASEANELALRLARAHTGGRDVIVLGAAYHGHTTTLIDLSPYKFDGPGGQGRRPWVHVAPLPDDYRGPHKRGDPEAGRQYAWHVGHLASRIAFQGQHLAAFLAETLPSVGGQIVLPPGYLAEAYAHVRTAGGLCIADEVQVGFGRLGTHFWGFETQGVVPDLVVLGKPIGNGHPLAAVVTTPEIVDSFANGMEFFSTFGGNPVACAAGLAVLDVLEEEGLQERALVLGDRLLAGLRELQDRFPLIGDVRGSGLFLGVELVRDRATLEPAAREATYVVDRLAEEGILAGTDGPFHNVIKIRPPLCLAEADADLFLETLAEILTEDAAQA